ncbi:SURF1 family protein [Marimonas arenosa]|uniref:SURF1-like protein n=1 Tax=Marimonas arenosa TaxID=1795305 RepID=A0AAE3WHT0_9RHOB|nr:SURF1 family protein [Marimonas arenosa]
MIFSLVVLAVLVSLGNWQVRRLNEKRAYLDEIEAMIDAAPVFLPANPDPDVDRFRAVRASGRLTGPEVHVLVSTRGFGAGYRVIQAFETQGRRALLDRGFIRLTDKNRARGTEPITVTGNLYWPDETDRFTPENDLPANIWYARDVPPLAAQLGTEEVMIIARETVPDDPAITPLPIDTSDIPNRHLEYVLTWYGLALTWVVMSAYFLHRRRVKET